MESGSSKTAMSRMCQIAEMPALKVAQDTCDVTHSLTHASAYTPVMSTRQKECTKYSLLGAVANYRHFFSNERCSFGGGGGSEPVRLEEKSVQDGWSPWSPQASYDRRWHRNCFPTRKSASISEKVNISWGHRSVDAIFTCVDLHVLYYSL